VGGGQFPGEDAAGIAGQSAELGADYGTFVSGLQVSYAPLPGVVDSMSAIQNPTAPIAASLVQRAEAVPDQLFRRVMARRGWGTVRHEVGRDGNQPDDRSREGA